MLWHSLDRWLLQCTDKLFHSVGIPRLHWWLHFYICMNGIGFLSVRADSAQGTTDGSCLMFTRSNLMRSARHGVEGVKTHSYWKTEQAYDIWWYWYKGPNSAREGLLSSLLTRIEGLRTEDVVHFTDCKAHWGNVIVILGYINKIDLIWSYLIAD